MNDRDTETKRSILEKARSEPVAYLYLMSLFMDELYTFIRYCCPPELNICEVTERILTEVTQNYPSFRGNLRQFRYWLYQVATHQLRYLLKSNYKKAEAEKAAVSKDSVSEQAGIPILRIAVLDLEPELRIIVVLRCFQKFEVKEIADITRKKVYDVKQSLITAMKQLQTSEFIQAYGRNVQAGHPKAVENRIVAFLETVNYKKPIPEDTVTRLRRTLYKEYEQLSNMPGGYLKGMPKLIKLGAISGFVLMTLLVVLMLFISFNNEPSEPSQQETVQQDTNADDPDELLNRQAAQLKRIVSYANREDSDNLVQALYTMDPLLRPIISLYLVEIGDENALAALERIIASEVITEKKNTLVVNTARLRQRLEQERKEAERLEVLEKAELARKLKEEIEARKRAEEAAAAAMQANEPKPVEPEPESITPEEEPPFEELYFEDTYNPDILIEEANDLPAEVNEPVLDEDGDFGYEQEFYEEGYE